MDHKAKAERLVSDAIERPSEEAKLRHNQLLDELNKQHDATFAPTEIQHGAYLLPAFERAFLSKAPESQ